MRDLPVTKLANAFRDLPASPFLAGLQTRVMDTRRCQSHAPGPTLSLSLDTPRMLSFLGLATPRPSSDHYAKPLSTIRSKIATRIRRVNKSSEASSSILNFDSPASYERALKNHFYILHLDPLKKIHRPL